MTRTHTPRPSGEHYEVKRASVPKPAAPAFTLEDLAQAVAKLSGEPDVAVSVAQMSRKNVRQQKAIAGLTGVISLLLAVVGLMVSYLRGYTRGEKIVENDTHVEATVPEEETSDDELTTAKPSEKSPVSLTAIDPALLRASIELQIEQFNYLAKLVSASSNPKRKLPNDDALRRAESNLLQHAQANRERPAPQDPAR